MGGEWRRGHKGGGKKMEDLFQLQRVQLLFKDKQVCISYLEKGCRIVFDVQVKGYWIGGLL